MLGLHCSGNSGFVPKTDSFDILQQLQIVVQYIQSPSIGRFSTARNKAMIPSPPPVFILQTKVKTLYFNLTQMFQYQ